MHRARGRLPIQPPRRAGYRPPRWAPRETRCSSTPAVPAESSIPTDKSWPALAARPQNEKDHQAEGQRHQKPDGIGDQKGSPAFSSRCVTQPNGSAPRSKFMHQARQPESKGGDRSQKQTPANRAANGAGLGFGIERHALNIQVHDFQRVVFDELAARFDIFTHKCRENIFCGNGVFELHLKQRTRVRVHGRVPKLLGVHFAQPFESRDGEIFLSVFHHVVEHVGRLFLRHLVAITRHGERRMVKFFDLLGQAAQTLIFGCRCYRPIDLLAVRRTKLDFVQAMFFIEDNLAFEFQPGLLQLLQQLFESFLVLEVRLLLEAAFGQQFDERGFTQPAAEFRRGSFILLHVQQEGSQPWAFEIHAFLGFHDVVFRGTFHQLAREVAFVADVFFRLAALHAVERGLRDVDVPAVDQFLHVAEEKRKQQRAYVAAVYVRVGHQNNFVVAQLAGVEIVFANARAQRRDDGANFLVAEHLVVTRLLDVKDFAFERQDRLIFTIAAHFRRTARRFALDDEQFAPRGIAFLAIGEFSRQATRIHRGLAARQLSRFARSFAGARSFNTLAEDRKSTRLNSSHLVISYAV